jgi:hypothetical protein
MNAALLDSTGVTVTYLQTYSSTRSGASELLQCDQRNCDDTRVASISFVIVVTFVFEFRNESSAVLRLAGGMYALRIVTCKGPGKESLPWRSGYIVLDCLE